MLELGLQRHSEVLYLHVLGYLQWQEVHSLPLCRGHLLPVTWDYWCYPFEEPTLVASVSFWVSFPACVSFKSAINFFLISALLTFVLQPPFSVMWFGELRPLSVIAFLLTFCPQHHHLPSHLLTQRSKCSLFLQSLNINLLLCLNNIWRIRSRWRPWTVLRDNWF